MREPSPGFAEKDRVGVVQGRIETVQHILEGDLCRGEPGMEENTRHGEEGEVVDVDERATGQAEERRNVVVVDHGVS